MGGESVTLDTGLDPKTASVKAGAHRISYLRAQLNETYSRYQKPIFISEVMYPSKDELKNGTVEDDGRIDYFNSCFKAMEEAIEMDGVELMGEAIWGIIDQLSVNSGIMSKRYGIVYVDCNDDGSGSMNRYKKKSFDWYKEVVRSNGECLD